MGWSRGNLGSIPRREMFFLFTTPSMGRDIAVGISTRYGPYRTGIESRWGEIFRTRPDRSWDPPSLLYNGCRVFPGGKAAREWP
jgi:hypothetical protein